MEENLIGPPPQTAEIEHIPMPHHRRVLSDAVFVGTNSFEDLFDFDAAEFDVFNLPVLPSLQLSPPPVASVGIEDAAAMATVDSLSSEESGGWGSMPGPQEPALGQTRSLSVDSDIIAGDGADDGDKSGGKGTEEGMVDRRHRHSNSVDVGVSSFLVKKAMAPEKLAELARVDPKKAKRIIANRKSAAKSKERKVIYANELEKRVQTLKAQATNISAQLAVYERDTTALAARNKELKMCIEAKQQQAQLRHALNEALKEEVRCLRIKTSQFAAMYGDPSFGGLLSQFSSQLALHQFPNPPSQHHEAPLQPQLCMPPPPLLPPLPFGQPFSEQCGPSFSNFNQMN